MKTKEQKAVLEALRGVTAMGVLVFHLGHWLDVPGLATNAGLAVDFFFCLSGYVLAMVYRSRLDAGWGFWPFMKVRLIRLMPMIVVGTIISAAYVAFRIVVRNEGDGHWPLATATVLGLLDLPYLSAPDAIGGPQVFPLNGPQYSLFLEIVANAFWGAALLLRGRKVSVVLAGLGLAGVAILGLGGDQTSTFWAGLPRVFGSFYLGTLAYEIEPWLRTRVRYLFPVCLAAVAGLFFWPSHLPIAAIMLWIMVLSPLTVALGAGVDLPERVRPAALLLGRISFPIYALHYPFFCWINGAIQTVTHRQVPALEIPVVLLVVPLFSWLLLVCYDEPLRKLLGRRSKARPKPRAAPESDLVSET